MINICNDILDLILESTEITNSYCIGSKESEKRPVQATFNDAGTVYKILSKTRKLQGTGTKKIQKEAMKMNGKVRIYVKTDHLEIGEKRFYWDEEVGLMFKRTGGVDSYS